MAKELPSSIKTDKDKPIDSESAPLVNEKPGESLEQKVANAAGSALQADDQIASLTAQLSKQEGKIERLLKQLEDEKEKAQKAGYSDQSRQFRIFLAIIEGFTASGKLHPENLREGKGKTEVALFQHAVGLSMLANTIAREKF